MLLDLIGQIRSTGTSPTEQRNPRSRRLDRMGAEKAVALMLTEEANVAGNLLQHRRDLAKAVERIARQLKSGGRLLYVGAGTSGRLGVLDASECPPTFRTDPRTVQGIIAGGDGALRRSIEGAEDNVAAGVAAIRGAKVGKSDVVVGIAASGTTPYVWGALAEAKSRNAITILLCFNPHLQIPLRLRPWLVIAVDLGPEVLTGSTRLKAGTATKLVLNLFSTLAMVRLGKVISNLMVDVKPSNVKLRARAVRITRELTGMTEDAARAALEASGWVIKRAIANPGRLKHAPAPQISREGTRR